MSWTKNLKAVWNNTVIAECEKKRLIELEGNTYFPFDAVKKEFLQESDKQTECPWKGTASYYNLVVGEKTNPNAVWYYANPSKEAQKIKGFVSFWKGVELQNS